MELKGALADVGVRQAFSIADADFSRMSDDPVGLFLSAVLHNAFVEVNEKGTEAAAATGVVMFGGCAIDPEPPRTFRADHPFLFMIWDQPTRWIHFLGRVENPADGR